MTRQRYSIKESLNRILRSWKGTAIPSDQPDSLSGIILSEDNVYSDFAELMEGSLPGESAVLPPAVSVSAVSLPSASTTQAGIVELATESETQAGTSAVLGVTPFGLAAAISQENEYGGIYVTTGSVSISIGTSWTKITGSFKSDMPASSANVTPDWNDDRILVNDHGFFFVGFQLGFSGAANTTFDATVYIDSARQAGIETRRKLGTGGDVGSCSALGIAYISGSSVPIEIYADASGAGSAFQLETAQLWLFKIADE